METWIIMSLISIFAGGFVNFGMKTISQKKYNSSFASFILYMSSSICSGLYYFIFYWDNWKTGGIILLSFFAFANALFYFISLLSRVKSLNNVDTVIFFPLYKTFFPLIITGVSFFIFKETLSLKEFVGIVIGMMVPLLLITKSEGKKQKNIKMGLIFIFLTSLFSSIATMFPKLINLFALNIDLFIFIASLFGMLLSFLNYKVFHKNDKTLNNSSGVYLLGGLIGIFQFVGFYTFTYALSGNLAVVVTINSFSILIPIILSVVFYGEEMTCKKAFVVLMSIISVILFL